MRTPTTADDLLVQVYDLSGLMGQRKWTAKDVEGNPPRAIRHQQIEARLRSLDLDPDVPAFLDGEFLAHRPVADSKTFLRVARSAVLSDSGGSCSVTLSDDWVSPKTLVRVYRRLIAYRLSAERLLQSNAGVIEATGLYRYPIVATATMNRRLVVGLRPLERALALLVDPHQRRVPRATLIRDFGFPDVDLNEVDTEWI